MRGITGFPIVSHDRSLHFVHERLWTSVSAHHEDSTLHWRRPSWHAPARRFLILDAMELLFPAPQGLGSHSRAVALQRCG